MRAVSHLSHALDSGYSAARSDVEGCGEVPCRDFGLGGKKKVNVSRKYKNVQKILIKSFLTHRGT